MGHIIIDIKWGHMPAANTAILKISKVYISSTFLKTFCQKKHIESVSW